MSSTNRSDARKEHIADYYRTPISDIENFFSELDNVITIDMDKYTLDPAGGGGCRKSNELSNCIA